MIVTRFVPAVPVGVPVILPFVNVNPAGKSVTTIGLLSRIPTPPVLSTAVTGISGIGSLFVTVAPFALIVGPVTSVTVTGTFTLSNVPSGYVTFTTAFPALPALVVDGLLTIDNVPGAKLLTFAFNSASVIVWFWFTVNSDPVGLWTSAWLRTVIVIVFVVGVLFLSYALIVTVLFPAGPVGVPVIRPFEYVNPAGNPVTSIGLFWRIPTPPVLSTAVTGIGVICSRLVTVALFAVIVGPVTSVTVTGTFTLSNVPSGYVTFTTAFPAFPAVAVDGLLTIDNVPGA